MLLVLLLEYIGTDFSGSQRQANAYTVQQALEEGLTCLNIQHRAVVLSGRTDAGVHAKGQVAHVRVNGLENITDIISALNAVLPDTLAIKDFVITDDMDFHAISKAQWRWYRYNILNQPYRSAWMPADTLWIRQPLDVDAMQEAAQHFKGTHLFTSFKSLAANETHDLCTVIHSHISQAENIIMFDVIANRFLYKMVRNFVGTLLEVGFHRQWSPADVPVILAAQNRQKAGPTADPAGLSLMAVNYPEPWDFFKNDVYVKKLKHIVSKESIPDEKDLHCKTA